MRPVGLVVVEGALEVPASLKILRTLRIPVDDLFPIDKGGHRKFWRDVNKYNQAAAQIGVVIGLADLEAYPCPSGLMQKHFDLPKRPNFLLRIAERMLESWLLADTDGLSSFLQISADLLPHNPDADEHPKRTLINLARRSPVKSIRADLVPEPGSSGIVGKVYTPRMTEFIERRWHPRRASKRSESLRRALLAIQKATI